MRAARRRVFRTVFLLALILPTGCDKEPTASGAPVVTNDPDDFSYQGTRVVAKTGTETFAWQNSGTSASVDQNSTVSSGFMTLTLYDHVGTQVYQRSLTDKGAFPTERTGTAGMWTIRIDYARATGTVAFRAQKV